MGVWLTSDVKMGNLEDDVPEPSELKCKKGKKVGCARPLGQTGYAPFVPFVAFISIPGTELHGGQSGFCGTDYDPKAQQHQTGHKSWRAKVNQKQPSKIATYRKICREMSLTA